MNHIAQSKEFLRVFAPLLISLMSETQNMCIGGTAALALTGINLPASRTINDLDIIIFQPTEAQLSTLKTLSVLCSVDSTDYPVARRKIFQFVKGTCTMHILCVPDRSPIFTAFAVLPPDERFIPLNPVNGIIDAKAKYARPKDLQDLIDLKNHNFNLFNNGHKLL